MFILLMECKHYVSVKLATLVVPAHYIYFVCPLAFSTSKKKYYILSVLEKNYLKLYNPKRKVKEYCLLEKSKFKDWFWQIEIKSIYLISKANDINKMLVFIY